MKKPIFFTLAALAAIIVIITATSQSETPHTYEVVHHGNLRDTVTTTRYRFHYEEKTLDAQEGGIFTKVEYIRRIDR